jgi:glycosyltransferase involved in cell wall biosynthesis
MTPYSLIKAASFTPNSMQSPNAWIGHLPFAAWVIQEVSPKIFVELGTHSGNSYFAFCQSVVETGISSKCYAVDTWRGDEYAGLYGEDIFAKVNAYHQEHYSQFSRLLRMTFDDAVTYFADESIDMLHIDGLHSYEAVRHDFETWLPKLAPGAVVILHDTNVRERHFGVWKLWEELQGCYPNNLEFVQSNGLGVLQLNNAPDNRKLEWLLPNSPEKQRLIVYFAALGSRQLDLYELNELKQQIDNLNQAVAKRDVQIADLKNKMAKFDGNNTSLNSLLKWLKAQLQLVKRFISVAIHPFKAYRLSRDVQTIKNSSIFDVDYYLSSYPDVRVSACSPLQHYCEFGWKEGRNPSPLFNTNNYLMNNPDVAALGTNPLVHYINFGKFEGRDPLPVDNLDVPLDPCRRAELMLQASDGIRRILVIDCAVPTPDRDSGSVRMFGILRIMREMGFSVTFAADKLENGANYIAALNSLEINVLQGYTEIRRHLQKWGNGYAVVIISRPEMGERYLSVVRAYAAQAQLDYDTVDLYHLRFKRGAELTGNPDLVKKAQEYHQLEMLCCTSADRVFAITETEKKVIQQNWPNTQVEVIPNIHPVKVSPLPWSAREGLVFIGGYGHHPNVDAVVWFVQEIFPIITKKIPGIKFTILGSNPPEALRSLASTNVNVTGWVPDPEPYFSASRIFVAPLRYGAGMKGKVGQAMSLGLPVVTTQIGAEGMQLKDNAHALIADTPEAFAAAVVRLYNDEALWKRIQRNSAAHIDKNFSESVVESILREIWSERIASHDSALGATA